MAKVKKRKPKALQGGLGGRAELIDRRTACRDLKMIRQAINNGWLIPERAMAELPEKMLELALSSASDDRARVSAAKVLVSMVGQCREAAGTTVNVGVVVQGQDLLD